MWVLGCHSRPVHCNSQPVLRRKDEVTLAFFRVPMIYRKRYFSKGVPFPCSEMRVASRTDRSHQGMQRVSTTREQSSEDDDEFDVR
jgi:hypothetical protein